MQDIEIRILNGADKVCLNQALFENVNLADRAAKAFGSQAIVASIDYRFIGETPTLFINQGKINSGISLMDWAVTVESAGVGEILLNCIDRDGKACGYDIQTIRKVSDIVSIPVIACGGAGNQKHFLDCYVQTNASGVAAGNYFHFTENAYPRLKKFLKTHLLEVR